MKNKDIKSLLDKYANGEISGEELQMLEAATHRDEVMKSAMGRAVQIRRKRWQRISCVTAVLVLVCGVGLFMRPMWSGEDDIEIVKVEPMPIPVETVDVDAMEVEEPMTEVEKRVVKPEKVVEKSIEKPVEYKVVPVKAKEVVIVPMVEEAIEMEVIHTDSEPQVLCNLECDADSVINEVWNFLKV